MANWVARHWHVLQRVKPVSANLSSFPRFSILRSYSQSSDGHVTSTKLHSANSAIIIPSSVVGTTPEDLIQHIEPVDQSRLTRDRFAVFLVTPSFAQWLLDDAVFVQKALRRAFVNMPNRDMPDATVHALCAVVDKLPAPRSIQLADGIKSLRNEVQLRMRDPPMAETGFEGMAYTTLRLSDSIVASSSLPVDQAAISFVVPKTKAETLPGLFEDSMRLPLANTVFQTGHPSTMIYSTWEKAKDSAGFSLKSSQHVTHHGIKIHSDALDSQQISSLAVPLVPLTVPRKVEGSMGNILRRIVSSDGKSMQASHELEQVVPHFYGARGESAQATMVWALVMSTEMLQPIMAATNSMLERLPGQMTDSESWENLWKKKPAAWNDLVSNALASGARLHRVLSGGGGWGKKAGLLSLDPMASVPEPSHDGTFEPSDLSSALQQVARDGDYIQFFISPANSANERMDQLEKLKTLDKLDQKWSWELGTIPSTADALPAGSWQHNSSTPKETFVFRDSFGALTEAGMTIDRQFKLEPHEPLSLIGGSKLDVPFSRFSAISVGGEDAHGKHLMHENLAPLTTAYHPNLMSSSNASLYTQQFRIRKILGTKTSPFLGFRHCMSDPKYNLNDDKEVKEQELVSNPSTVGQAHAQPPRIPFKVRYHLTPDLAPTSIEIKRLNNELCYMANIVANLTREARRLIASIRLARGHMTRIFHTVVETKQAPIRENTKQTPIRVITRPKTKWVGDDGVVVPGRDVKKQEKEKHEGERLQSPAIHSPTESVQVRTATLTFDSKRITEAKKRKVQRQEFGRTVLAWLDCGE